MESRQTFTKYRKINIDNNQRKWILHEIAHIHFPSLQQLFLNDNRIESIECFSQMKMHPIKYLNISNNRIVSIKCLRKVKWDLIGTLLFGKDNTNIDKNLMKEMTKFE